MSFNRLFTNEVGFYIFLFVILVTVILLLENLYFYIFSHRKKTETPRRAKVKQLKNIKQNMALLVIFTLMAVFLHSITSGFFSFYGLKLPLVENIFT